MSQTIDHDRLFKELLTTFFVEFVELFMPEVAAYLDRDSIVFLDKEIFTDVTSGDVHEADIVARCRFRDTERFFLIHVEDQAKPQTNFPRRMFKYFARLFETHDLDVYPIVLFTYDRPMRPEPDRFRVNFPDMEVLHFRYRAIQLNRLDWRKYIQQQNPIAAALMAKMKIAFKDRPHVKPECLRLLATLRLNPAKARLISGFVHTYLKLNAAENVLFVKELEALAPEERQPMIQLTNEWIEEGERRGREEGQRQGREEGQRQGREEGAAVEARALLFLLGGKRLGPPGDTESEQIHAIADRARLEILCERLFDVATWQELLRDP